MKNLSIITMLAELVLLTLAIYDLMQGRYFNAIIEITVAALVFGLSIKYLRKNNK